MSISVTARPPASFKLDDLALMSRATNYFAWQARLVKPWLGQRWVLEVGSGTGNFTAHLLDRELVVALDVDPDCIAKVREQLYPDVRAICAPWSRTRRDFRYRNSLRFASDSCVCLNVLEHIADDRGCAPSDSPP